MFCPTCGAWSGQESTYCSRCGKPLALPAVAQQPPAPTPAAPSGTPPPDAPPASDAPSTPAAGPAFPPVPFSQPGRPWNYRSASGLATTITVFASIAAVLYGLGAAIGLAAAASEDFEALDSSESFLFLGFLDLCGLGIVLIVWTRRIAGNLLPFQPALELGTRWAIASWFVPIVSYWFPLRIWNQAWRATTPTLTPPIGWQWKGLPVPVTHALCWSLYLIGTGILSIGILNVAYTVFPFLLGGPIGTGFLSGAGFWDSTGYGYLILYGGTMVVVSMVLLVAVVRNLTARQDDYARRFLPGFPS